MKKHVILTATPEGELFVQRTNDDGSPKLDKNGLPFGSLRVENPSEVNLAFAHNNGGVKRGQSALVSITVEAFEKNKRYYKDGMEIPGNVRIVESLTKELGMTQKFAGDAENGGIACTVKGAPIYRKTEFDPTGLLADVLIPHDNTEEISAAALARNKANKVTTVEALNG